MLWIDRKGVTTCTIPVWIRNYLVGKSISLCRMKWKKKTFRSYEEYNIKLEWKTTLRNKKAEIEGGKKKTE